MAFRRGVGIMKIFVSHSSEDRKLVKAFVKMLQLGVGISFGDITCTSITGTIPPGQNMHDKIRESLLASDVFIPVISLPFINSRYCMFELGASWALSKNIIPVIVPPLSFQHMESIISQTEAVRVDYPHHLSNLRDTLHTTLQLSPVPTAIWEQVRMEFLQCVTEVINRGECWVYTLLGIREGRPMRIIGCFRVDRVPEISNAITVIGQAYWVEMTGELTFRGFWTTDEALFSPDRFDLFYHMTSPAPGDPHNEQPSNHDGIIHLVQAQGSPIHGDRNLRGFVHDLFDWRNNSPDMYAEKISLSWEDTIAFVKRDGNKLFEDFCSRI